MYNTKTDKEGRKRLRNSMEVIEALSLINLICEIYNVSAENATEADKMQHNTLKRIRYVASPYNYHTDKPKTRAKVRVSREAEEVKKLDLLRTILTEFWGKDYYR